MIRHGISVKLEHVQRHCHHDKEFWNCDLCNGHEQFNIHTYIGERAYEWFNVDKMKHANKEHTADIWCHKNCIGQDVHDVTPFLGIFRCTAVERNTELSLGAEQLTIVQYTMTNIVLEIQKAYTGHVWATQRVSPMINCKTSENSSDIYTSDVFLVPTNVNNLVWNK